MKTPITLPECTNEKVPALTHPFYHSVAIQTRFTDFDMFGHLNNNAYFQYADVAKMAYFEAVMGKPVTPVDLKAVIVNINGSFFSPTTINEPVVVLTACVKVSGRSFILEQRIVNPTTGDVKFVATVVLAAFDPATATGTHLDAAWAEAMTHFESGK